MAPLRRVARLHGGGEPDVNDAQAPGGGGARAGRQERHAQRFGSVGVAGAAALQDDERVPHGQAGGWEPEVPGHAPRAAGDCRRALEVLPDQLPCRRPIGRHDDGVKSPVRGFPRFASSGARAWRAMFKRVSSSSILFDSLLIFKL